MEEIKFEVLEKPVAKGRPRKGKFGMYTPKRTKSYEQLVRESFKKAYNIEPYKGEIKVKITAIFEVPKSYSKKKREALLPWDEDTPTSAAGYMHKPDIDNVVKSILDSLNGLAYEDDKQVTCLLVFKVYGKESKVIVELEEMA